LTEANVDSNKQNNKQQTPLHLACLSGSEGIVSHLLRHKARIDILDIDGNSPIICVALSNLPKAATLAGTMINRGDVPNTPNKLGCSALHYAAQNDDIDLVRMLLQLNLDPLQKDVKGLTPVDYTRNEKIKSMLQTV